MTDALLSGTKANVLNIMGRCVVGVADILGDRNGLLGAREIAAIVSVNVLLLSERSLFDSARTWRLASNACSSTLVL